MDYEKKYNNVVNKFAYLLESTDLIKGELRQDIESIFPELKESEDERIRKELVDFIYDKTDTYELREKSNSWLAWIEKQGEQNPVISEDALREGIAHFGITQYQIDNWLKKYVDVEKQGEQKTSDKVEPKFEIEKGKWYVCIRDLLDNYANKAFCKGDIYLSTQNGSLIPSNSNVPFEVVCPDTYFKDWTIQDAKDGDVIYSRHNTESFEWIGIFKSLDKENKRVFFYGFWHIMAESFSVCGNKAYVLYDDFSPATKAQCDLLFQKMKEDGYEWDAEKKELKKIAAPIFHIGDRVRYKGHSCDGVITEITNTDYICGNAKLPISTQDKLELVEQNPSWSEEDE